ncbi:hypothetical protein HMPREF2128_02520 [Pseudoglutamicibacter albus DNF00011]|uniref:Uncharacterized protein n=1 Tax=Pseudoglutamicibacter albus DNF00011 TaxID=1401063 RepID=A0A095ZRY6_9MICC|nr:hypothetical protein HMPREF2128_00720 [Pseudoglutamicibacter albus DNF00011]KGF21540.1 hypothetical protein HMPREF2128_02520 [Pseudoglutamicibacter albus DNF00011]
MSTQDAGSLGKRGTGRYYVIEQNHMPGNLSVGTAMFHVGHGTVIDSELSFHCVRSATSTPGLLRTLVGQPQARQRPHPQEFHDGTHVRST